MCGIAGYVGPASPELLPAMLAVLGHRGPDDRGTHVEPDAAGGVGLGMTRLAIIDLVSGAQPMARDGRHVIVFNGEIYNFRQLRAELEARGCAFRTRSDTEVILAAYAVWGDACVERLRGMFAFALWDREGRRLLLARDRLGKKPLYYWRRPGLLLFASEIKALLRHPEVGRGIDWEAFHHYLAFGYTPARRSIFAGIAKLPAAHTAVVSEGRMQLRRYWRLPAGGAPTTARAAEARALVREQVREAVRLRLQSDVPLGVFLSGGIDSSAVVAAMREVTSGPIATFSIGFGPRTASFDELPHARMVARRFDTEHHEEVLEPDVAGLLPAIVRCFDEPFADSSSVATYVVARATAGHVKVALSGIGGDETFAGYPRYLGLRLSRLYARVPSPVQALAAAAAPRVFRDSDRSRNLADWSRRFVSGAGEPLPDRYLNWTRFFTDAALDSLVTAGVRAAWAEPVDEAQRAAWARRRDDDPVDGAQRIDLETYLPDDLLVMADRLSMAHSLELRAPFCDHVLVEAGLGLPAALKLRRWSLKWLLRAAFADVLPRPVLEHRKHGFMIPLARWLRTDLRKTLEDLLHPEHVRRRGVFDPAAVAELVREHLEGRRSHADRLWALMMTELWMRLYLDTAGGWSARA